MWYLYTTEYYSAIKKMNLENIILREIRQTEKDNNNVIFLICGI